MSIVVPPLVPGDPETLRALARTFNEQAQKLGDTGTRLSSGFASLTFEGPAAIRMAQKISYDKAVVDRAAGRLMDAYAALMKAASEVEQAQAERARMLRVIEERNRTTTQGQS